MIGGRQLHVVETLGKGGFGVVMRAWLEGEHGFIKEVAVKLLSHEASREEHLLHRLRDEARLMGLVNHRAIVRSDGLALLGGRWAVIMELVHGVSLARFIRRKGALPLSVGVEVLAEVASALAAMHSAVDPAGEPLQMLHRDVKPGNVLITAAGDVKLLDFGNARADYDAREARTGQLTYGTLAYMAPERFMGGEAPAGDVYSLGAMAFELLSARRFGPAGVEVEEHRPLREERMRWMAHFLGPEGAPVVRLLDGMLQFDPARRPRPAAVERALLELSQSLPGPSLRLWAMDNVPELLSKTRAPWTPPSADREQGPRTTWVSMSPPLRAPGAGPREPARSVAPLNAVTLMDELPRPRPVPAPDRATRPLPIVAGAGSARRPAPATFPPRGVAAPSLHPPSGEASRPVGPPPPPPARPAPGPPAPTPVVVAGVVTAPASRRSRPDWWLGALAAAAGLGVLVPFLILGSAAVLAATDALARGLDTGARSAQARPGVVLEPTDWPEVEARPVDGGEDDVLDALHFASVAPIEEAPARPATPPVLAVREAPVGGAEAPVASTRVARRGRVARAPTPAAPPAAVPVRPAAPAAPDAQAGPPRGRVSLSGDAVEAVLIDSDGARYPVPGAVPSGTYGVRATFPGQPPATAGTVRVSGAATLELECLSRFALCRPS